MTANNIKYYMCKFCKEKFRGKVLVKSHIISEHEMEILDRVYKS